ncbi:MAG: extracellular solute-binding protein, partial [Synergistaceae bacterium]|nr:extracellular solute-binding protein [Synergistaceae bacterium]
MKKLFGTLLFSVLCISGFSGATYASGTLNAYTIWSERYATEIFDAFTRETGVKVNFLRFPSGEVLARLIAEKNNPQVDVFFGGIADAFVAGKKEGIFEPYVPLGAKAIPERFRDIGGWWTGGA